MNGRRLLVATETFWPLVGREATSAMNLAVEMSRRGMSVEIVTPRHHPSWPAAIALEAAQVTRIGPAPYSRLNRLRYYRALRRWTLAKKEAVDAAYVFGAGDELTCLSAIAARDARFKLVAAPGKASFDDRRRRPIQRAAPSASLFVASSEMEARRLAVLGVDRHRLSTAPMGVAERAIDVDGTLRACARASLGEIHPALMVAEETPLAVHVGRLRAGRGLERLIDAWSLVARDRPEARLWLVGEGPDARLLFKRVGRQELEGHVVFTGAFDDPGDMYRAADLAIATAFVAAGPSLAHLEALAAGIPVLSINSEGLEGENAPAIIPPSSSVDALAATILEMFADPARRMSAGHDGRRIVARQRSLAAWSETHYDIFARLLAR